jgi:hypothetical protein
VWAEDGRDAALEELSAAEDSDELCRLLIRPAGGRSSTRHREAVDLLRGVSGPGEFPASLTALLLCTCRRWDRVTAKLVAPIEDSGLLTGAELDELAESLVSDEVVVVFPARWISERWEDADPADGSIRTITVPEEAVARDERRPEPPLRRWAASRTLRRDPGWLDDLLQSASILPPLHRDALLHGLLDAADHLEPERRRDLVSRGLHSGIARVRRAALDRLCKLDGPEAALRRARSDTDRTVRAWQPPGTRDAPEPPPDPRRPSRAEKSEQRAQAAADSPRTDSTGSAGGR